MHLEKILKAVDALGGRAAWGIEQRDDEYHADPAVLADRLIVHTAALLRAVQQATPVEQLPGFAEIAPLTEPTDDLFGKNGRTRVRLQLGLPTLNDGY
jgi:hypothetical protein